MSIIHKILSFLLCIVLLLSLAPAAWAEEPEMAGDISSAKYVTDSTGFRHHSFLFDKDLTCTYPVYIEATLTLEHEEGFGSLYLLFDQVCGEYTVTSGDTGRTVVLGQQGYLHDYVDLVSLLGHAPKSLTIRFPNGVRLVELYLFTPGQVPDFVQKWEPPANGKADLVLFSTHGDDEQLFFAGLLPYYAGELGLNVQVVYLIGHQKSMPNRMHEMLDGLYAVGVRNYPVLGHFPDQLSKNMASAYSFFAYAGYTREMLLEFVVENLRRFKPLVAVGHDINGEYKHGQHMVYTDLLMEAVQISGSAYWYPESADRWGTWDTPKTYLHLYEENPIVMDWDRPLEKFGGKTAFEVTRDIGFPCHKSQYYDFLWYLTQAPVAAKFLRYSPCNYGLFRSTVGEDVEKNEFFENLWGFVRPPLPTQKWNLPLLPGEGEKYMMLSLPNA